MQLLHQPLTSNAFDADDGVATFAAVNNNGTRTPHRSEQLAALHAAERRICARLSLAVRLTSEQLDLSQSAIAEAAGFTGDQGRIRVNRLLSQIPSLPTVESRTAAKMAGRSLRGKQATYRIIATIAELAEREGVRIEDLTMASQPDLLALLDEAIAVSQLVRSMADRSAPSWWLQPCPHGDLEAAVVLAERLLWGFALQGDMVSGLEHRLASTWSGSWETILADDLALADLANQLLLETVDRLDTEAEGSGVEADGAGRPRRAAILSRQVMRGYRSDPTLRVAFETLANRLLAERWTIGLAFSRQGDPPPGPEARADYVDLLLSDLNHPGILVPLVDLPLETPDGVYIDRVGHATVVAAGRQEELAVSSTVLPRRSPRREQPGDQVTIDLALSALDDKLADQRRAEDALRRSGSEPGVEPGIETVDAALMGEPDQRHQTLDRFDEVSLVAPSEQLARYSILETVGKLDAGPLYAVSPGPSLSLFPPEVTERQFVAWSAHFPNAVDQALLHELKLTRLMKNQALRRNHRRFIHRHLIPVEGLRDFFLGRPGTNAVFDNPLYGHRYLTTEDRKAIKDKIVRMLGETVAAQRADRGLLLALPTADEITSLAGLWATITVGDPSGAGQVHLVHRSADDVAANTAVLANLRGLSVDHFRAPNVLIGFLDMLWRRLPAERTEPTKVLARVRRMKVT
ncbi:MAG: hypothetical protein AAF962_16675 [Actinomycetota bacterium]